MHSASAGVLTLLYSYGSGRVYKNSQILPSKTHENTDFQMTAIEQLAADYFI